jgi:hypothetical protein
MKSTPFDPAKDAAPLPFTDEVWHAAKRMKESGLRWRPHVGCFVWDETGVVGVPSPFPLNIYFILNMGHFLRIFGTVEEMTKKLVWIPTGYQLIQYCRRRGIELSASDLEDIPLLTDFYTEEGLLLLYTLVENCL